MSFASISSKKLGAIPLDVIMEERHRSELNITDHPVEKGADITDHAYPKPKEVSMSAAIGNPPLTGYPSSGPVYGSADARISASYEALVALQEAAEPFTVVTGLKVYNNMLIQGLSAFRDVAFSRVLNFEAHLREINIVGSQSYAAENAEGQGRLGTNDVTTQNNASPTAARGEISAPQVSTSGADTTSVNNASILKRITG